MEAYKVIEIKKSVFESNDREAEKLRAELKAEKTFLVNLMSSPVPADVYRVRCGAHQQDGHKERV